MLGYILLVPAISASVFLLFKLRAMRKELLELRAERQKFLAWAEKAYGEIIEYEKIVLRLEEDKKFLMTELSKIEKSLGLATNAHKKLHERFHRG